MAKSVSLPNGRFWKAQTAALDHFKDMLRRYADEETVEHYLDHDDLVALLERYDAVIIDGPTKIGRGIDYFFRRQNAGQGFSTPGFWVRRVDGSETDFSYIQAVKGQPKSDAQEFYDACRAAVAADLLAAKKRHFTAFADSTGRVPCDLTGELLAFPDAHLDHAYPTFGQLVITFRAARGWQHGAPKGTLTLPADAQTTSTFVDSAVAQAFRLFHHGAATLRIVARHRNLSMAAGQRRPRVKLPVQILG
ncbi:DCL family protein [Bradyrhizobium sp. CCGUVB4N]|uniref:DCL family protein n=1 Tax=Bradyrhizobium sp. CCGUVB4N TaxID=2949631 RepID=UPI0020B3ADAB|nr:DCL family protein [Bradyrhizobium sp. CCGUVB4N]MCP3379995.1 DCL family protein [Bradyrhizobium sp. CCGUVB4N]